MKEFWKKRRPANQHVLESRWFSKTVKPFYDCFPLDEFLSRRQIRALLPAAVYTPRVRPGASRRASPVAADSKEAPRFKVQYGPSLTVGMASGDIQTADARFRRHGALAENMEGSAIAQTCLLFDVPFLEFRGISNMAGVRDKAKWDLGAAIDIVSRS